MCLEKQSARYASVVLGCVRLGRDSERINSCRVERDSGMDQPLMYECRESGSLKWRFVLVIASWVRMLEKIFKEKNFSEMYSKYPWKIQNRERP